jgi:hypothetical protein
MKNELQILSDSSYGLNQAGSGMVTCSEELDRDIDKTDIDGIEFSKAVEYAKTAGVLSMSLSEVLKDVVDEATVSYSQENEIEEKGLNMVA